MKSKVVKIPKVIKFEIDGKSYKLEFNREVVKQIEKDGFKIDKIQEFPVNMLPKLIHGAFLMHNPNMSEEDAMEIYANLQDKDKLPTKLFEMYSDAFNSIFGDVEEDESKNAKWDASW